jgi:hypothetical protein
MGHIHLSRAALGALLLLPSPAPAFDCEFYQTCCEQLVDAYREAGVRGADLDNFARTCTLHHVFDAMPGAQALFCLDAWEAMSREAYSHFQQGRIGFYPEACMADPLADPDEILEPDPSFPEPDPEAEIDEME